jgi:ferredoxin
VKAIGRGYSYFLPFTFTLHCFTFHSSRFTFHRGLDLPDRNDRVKENISGIYYVDSSCIDCDVCRDTAPENFKRSDANSYSFVFKQPESEEEKSACEEALTCCPVEAIGNDGE